MAQRRSRAATGDPTVAIRSTRSRRLYQATSAAELTEIGRLFQTKLRQLEADDQRRKMQNRQRTRARARRRRLPPAAQQPPEDQLLGTAEVAQLLGVHPRTVGNWAKDGLPCFRTLGGFRRFRWGQVRAWILTDDD
jgi:excisionase family DNA binding protein